MGASLGPATRLSAGMGETQAPRGLQVSCAQSTSPGVSWDPQWGAAWSSWSSPLLSGSRGWAPGTRTGHQGMEEEDPRLNWAELALKEE